MTAAFRGRRRLPASQGEATADRAAARPVSEVLVNES